MRASMDGYRLTGRFTCVAVKLVTFFPTSVSCPSNPIRSLLSSKSAKQRQSLDKHLQQVGAKPKGESGVAVGDRVQPVGQRAVW